MRNPSLIRRRVLLAIFAILLFCANTHISVAQPLKFTVLHTNDLHSQLNGLGPDAMFTPQAGDGDPVLGHYARLMTIIKSVRADRSRKGSNVILLDAGDAQFGTLFHVLGPCSDTVMTPEFRFFSEAGYSAMGLGNHDFDADEKGLALALGKAEKSGYNLPFVATNILLAADKKDACPLKSFFKAGGSSSDKVAIQDFRILTLPAGESLSPVNIGIMGLIGPNAAELCAATRKTVQFAGYNDSKSKADAKAFHQFVQKKVDDLKIKHGCKIVVALLHGGEPEDEALAREVTGIDIIIAGHTHNAYIKTVGKTVIAQTGHGGANVGLIDFEYDSSGLKVLNEKAARIAVNDRIPADPGVLKWIEEASEEVDRLISSSNFSMDDPICEVTRDRKKARFPKNEASVFTASTLLRAVNRNLTKPVDLYFSTYGLVRSEYLTVNGNPTPYAFSDVFRFSPLGFAADGSPGAPIVVFNLSRMETKLLLELMNLLSKGTPAYEPAVSDNLVYKINKLGVPMVNRISKARLNGKSFWKWPKRIRIATTLFFAENLFKIRSRTKGVIRITPKDDEGKPITEFKDSGLPREHVLLASELRRVNNEETDPNLKP